MRDRSREGCAVTAAEAGVVTCRRALAPRSRARVSSRSFPPARAVCTRARRRVPTSRRWCCTRCGLPCPRRADRTDSRGPVRRTHVLHPGRRRVEDRAPAAGRGPVVPFDIPVEAFAVEVGGGAHPSIRSLGDRRLVYVEHRHALRRAYRRRQLFLAVGLSGAFVAVAAVALVARRPRRAASAALVDAAAASARRRSAGRPSRPARDRCGCRAGRLPGRSSPRSGAERFAPPPRTARRGRS